MPWNQGRINFGPASAPVELEPRPLEKLTRPCDTPSSSTESRHVIPSQSLAKFFLSVVFDEIRLPTAIPSIKWLRSSISGVVRFSAIWNCQFSNWIPTSTGERPPQAKGAAFQNESSLLNLFSGVNRQAKKAKGRRDKACLRVIALELESMVRNPSPESDGKELKQNIRVKHVIYKVQWQISCCLTSPLNLPAYRAHAHFLYASWLFPPSLNISCRWLWWPWGSWRCLETTISCTPRECEYWKFI